MLSLQNLNAFLLKKWLFSFLQQLKKELEQFANSNNWDVRSAVKSGRIRGYSGIQLQRPRRRPALEFGGRVMLQRLQHYMRENPKPDPPIEVSILLFAFPRHKHLSLTNNYYILLTKVLNCILVTWSTQWSSGSGNLCLCFTRYTKMRDHMRVRGRAHFTRRSWEAWSFVQRARKALHPYGHREWGDADCVSFRK